MIGPGSDNNTVSDNKIQTYFLVLHCTILKSSSNAEWWWWCRQNWVWLWMMSGQYWKWIPSPTTHAGIWVTTSLYHHLQNNLLINLKKRQRQRQECTASASQFLDVYVSYFEISRSSSSLPPPKPWYEDPQHAGKLETTWSRHLPTANFNLMSLSSSTCPPRGIQATTNRNTGRSNLVSNSIS